MSSYLSLLSTLTNSKFGLDSECMATCTYTSSGIERLVWLICFFSSILTTNKSSASLLSKTSHNKSPLKDTKNKSLIVLNLYPQPYFIWLHTWPYLLCIVAPKRHKFCFASGRTLCFSKRPGGLKTHLKARLNQCYQTSGA